jgi:2-phospho-L-lactate guanylyltransferase
MTTSPDVWAVVPVKRIDQAKQRLSPVLPVALRRRLVLAMLEDVLAALTATPCLTRISIVTSDPAAAEIAGRVGALVIGDQADAGLSVAINATAHTLAREGRGAMLMVPGDVPLISAAEVVEVIDAGSGPRGFVIVPAHDRRGSNAVLCAPPDAVPLDYSGDSFLPHLKAARSRGFSPKVLPLPGIGLDIDTPYDLESFIRTPSATLAYAVLVEAGLAPIR